MGEKNKQLFLTLEIEVTLILFGPIPKSNRFTCCLQEFNSIRFAWFCFISIWFDSIRFYSYSIFNHGHGLKAVLQKSMNSRYHFRPYTHSTALSSWDTVQANEISWIDRQVDLQTNCSNHRQLENKPEHLSDLAVTSTLVRSVHLLVTMTIPYYILQTSNYSFLSYWANGNLGWMVGQTTWKPNKSNLVV